VSLSNDYHLLQAIEVMAQLAPTAGIRIHHQNT
jgi:hypothetical protein